MPDYTENHEFQLWPDGETEWEHRTDFETLDKRLELRGQLQDRPSQAPDGTKYVVTGADEQGAVFIYDKGSNSWEKQPVDGSRVTTNRVSINGSATGDAPLEIAKGEDDVAVAQFMNAKDDGNNNERKVEIRSLNEDGSKKLSAWSPSEVKGDYVEQSFYIRDIPISTDSQSLKKWLNVTNEGTDTDGELFVRPTFRSIHHLDFVAGDGLDLQLNYHAGSSSSSQTALTQRYFDFDGDIFFVKKYSPGTGSVIFLNKWDDQDNIQMRFRLKSNQIDLGDSGIQGLREVDPDSDTIHRQEWCWDRIDDRWLYKDSEGTTHYFESDGTLN